MTRVPRIISRDVLSLAETVVAGGLPVFVGVEPRVNGEINECFANVERQVMKHGGEIEYGWAIWEWPTVLIEAEFHAIWRAPDGRRVDVTPRIDDERTIAFVPDPTRVFEGSPLDNIRRPLRDDPVIHEFISLAEARFEIINRGHRALQFGAVSVPAEEIMPVMRRMTQLEEILRTPYPTVLRNDPCPCRSGKKFKKCHGKLT